MTARCKPWDLPMDGILSLTLRRKIRAKFGGRVKAWVSGGAPLNPEVGMFFQSLGITFLQGYGQTEAGAGDQLQPARASASGSTRSGRRSKNCEVRIAEDGEIMVRGENRDARLLAQSRRDRAGAARTAGSRPATSAISTTRAGSSSPTARRT